MASVCKKLAKLVVDLNVTSSGFASNLKPLAPADSASETAVSLILQLSFNSP